MKSVLIFMLFVGVAWGQTYSQTLESIAGFESTISISNFSMGQLEYTEKEIIEMPLAITGTSTTTTENMLIFKPPKYNEILIKDLSYCKKLCFELEGDKKRCVDIKWLYLLMVSAGIQED